MAKVENVGGVTYDNLIAGVKVPELVVVVTASEDFQRGTLVTIADGKATKATAEAGDNYGIIADDVKANEKKTAYKSGYFVRNTVEEITGIEISAAVEEAARKDGIHFADAV